MGPYGERVAIPACHLPGSRGSVGNSNGQSIRINRSRLAPSDRSCRSRLTIAAAEIYDLKHAVTGADKSLSDRSGGISGRRPSVLQLASLPPHLGGAGHDALRSSDLCARGRHQGLVSGRPLLVPNPGRGSNVYSPALAFFIAGLYLIPAGPLVSCIAFAIALAGIVNGTRPHKILLQLSATVISFGACSYFMKLGPRSGDPLVPPPELIAVEIFLGAVVLFAQLVLRSVAIRLERGHDAPHWGAFQPNVILEGAYCLALAVPISVLTRIHLALLGVVYLYVGFTWWVMDRYRQHLRILSAVAPKPEETRRRRKAA